ncbi:MAG: NUDIX domain-containing protein [Clostridiales Family XIII bacterium]|jgi:acetyl-CoA carboxylase carboxyl transferase subunit beta|nr:NUDIX domain-containing protein [Clostridiales Family XIII bacterium]
MWAGGARAIIPDEEGRLLLVRHSHEGRDIWMPPGGGIEEGEDAARAAAREVLEETGLIVEIGPLIWHVEALPRGKGRRFVNFFLAKIVGGAAALGADPELDAAHAVLRELRFFSREDADALPRVYPPMLREEVWAVVERGGPVSDVFRIREDCYEKKGGSCG